MDVRDYLAAERCQADYTPFSSKIDNFPVIFSRFSRFLLSVPEIRLANARVARDFLSWSVQRHPAFGKHVRVTR